MRALVLVVSALLILVSTPPRADTSPGPLDACQLALARASRQLGDGIRRNVGKCIASGLRCITDAEADQAACCAAATPRCQAQAAKLARTERRFAGRVLVGRCADVPFAAIIEPAGLGFANAADACRCLTVPTDVTDLHSLGVCLAQLVDSQTTRLLALAETPRAADALTCVGLDNVVATLEASDAVAECARPVPTATEVTPTAGATPTAGVTSTVGTTATGGITPASSATPRATHTPHPSRTPKSATPSAGVSPTSAIPTASGTTVPTHTSAAVASPTRSPTPQRTAIPTPSPTATSVCGNGVVEGDEECDGAAFDTSGCLTDVCTCDDFCDDAGGLLSCNPDCTINFSRCTAGGCAF